MSWTQTLVACRDSGQLLMAYGMGIVAGFAVSMVTLAFVFHRWSHKP